VVPSVGTTGGRRGECRARGGGGGPGTHRRRLGRDEGGRGEGERAHGGRRDERAGAAHRDPRDFFEFCTCDYREHSMRSRCTERERWEQGSGGRGRVSEAYNLRSSLTEGRRPTPEPGSLHSALQSEVERIVALLQLSKRTSAPWDPPGRGRGGWKGEGEGKGRRRVYGFPTVSRIFCLRGSDISPPFRSPRNVCVHQADNGVRVPTLQCPAARRGGRRGRARPRRARPRRGQAAVGASPPRLRRARGTPVFAQQPSRQRRHHLLVSSVKTPPLVQGRDR